MDDRKETDLFSRTAGPCHCAGVNVAPTSSDGEFCSRLWLSSRMSAPASMDGSLATTFLVSACLNSAPAGDNSLARSRNDERGDANVGSVAGCAAGAGTADGGRVCKARDGVFVADAAPEDAIGADSAAGCDSVGRGLPTGMITCPCAKNPSVPGFSPGNGIDDVATDCVLATGGRSVSVSMCTCSVDTEK